MNAIASNRAVREDVYTLVTNKIIASLEQGVRPWVKPWSAEHTAGRITRPLRHNGQAYRGINVLMLWGDAVEKGFVSPFQLTYKQAVEEGIPLLKAYTVFNAEHAEGLPPHF